MNRSTRTDTGAQPPTGISGSTGAGFADGLARRSCDGEPVMRHPLCDDSLREALRAAAPPGLILRSEAELDATLAQTLAAHDAAEDVHVFGYGSLMWNPALDVLGSSAARVPGWHRRFSLRLLFGRGSPEAPGAMLALDRGGACRGVLHRIAAAKVRDELRLLWRREMLGGAYDARWVWAWSEGRWLRALTFVAVRCHARYIGGLPTQAVAQLVRTGRGALGSSRDYFDATVETLRTLGIRDLGIERLRRAVQHADAGAAKPVPARLMADAGFRRARTG
jgi:cation transport protein ChaC